MRPYLSKVELDGFGVILYLLGPISPLSFTEIRKETMLSDSELTYCLKDLQEDETVEKFLIEGHIKYRLKNFPEELKKIHEEYTHDSKRLNKMLTQLFELYKTYLLSRITSKNLLKKPRFGYILDFIEFEIGRILRNTDLFSTAPAPHKEPSDMRELIRLINNKESEKKSAT